MSEIRSGDMAKCTNCGYEGVVRGQPFMGGQKGGGVSAPWCPTCGLNNHLVKSDAPLTEDGWRDQTWDHIQMVQSLLTAINNEINNRAAVHDHVKLQQPESAIFAKYTCRLRGMTYGSDEYNECLKEMKPALDHHYAHTKHHPEHYQNGVNSMTLVDLVEMLADWKAATLRHADGDIMKSLEINKKRFGLSDQLVQILLNTVKEMGWD